MKTVNGHEIEFSPFYRQWFVYAPRKGYCRNNGKLPTKWVNPKTPEEYFFMSEKNAIRFATSSK